MPKGIDGIAAPLIEMNAAGGQIIKRDVVAGVRVAEAVAGADAGAIKSTAYPPFGPTR